MFNQSRLVVGLTCLVLLTGCSTNKTLYHWGSYQQVILDSYTKPGSVDSLTQINTLTADIQKAESSEAKIPPGLYAQLGLMYAQQGMGQDSRAAFAKEKELFPESSRFIDGLINSDKLKGK